MVFSNPDGLSPLERSEANARANAPMDGLMKFVVKTLLLVFVVGIGISFFSNGTKLSVMHDYGLKQYLLNFIHFQDVQYNFVTNAAKVEGYSDMIDINKAQSTKSVVTLKKGNHFKVNGYQKDGSTYWYAAEAYDGDERKVFWVPDGPEWRKLWNTEEPEKHMLVKHTPVKIFENLRKMVEASWLKNIDFTIIPKNDKQAIAEAKANENLVQLPKPVSALARLKDILLDENHNYWSDKDKIYFAPVSSKEMREKITDFYYSEEARNMHATQLDPGFETPVPSSFNGVKMTEGLKMAVREIAN